MTSMEQKDTVSDTPLTGIHQKFSKIFNYKEVTCEKVALADLVELRNGGRPRLTPRPLFQSKSRPPRKNFVKNEKIRQTTRRAAACLLMVADPARLPLARTAYFAHCSSHE